MPLKILFAARPDRWQAYETPLLDACRNAGLDVDIRTGFENPTEVDYIVYAPNGPVTDFTPFTNARAVLNLWAGVEDVADNPTLKIPLARMVDGGLTEGMVEWVTGHVLRHHLGMDRHIVSQDGCWRPEAPPLARDRKVAVLGLGVLGQACAQTLAGLNFDVLGWSRRPGKMEKLTCESGADRLKYVLQRSDILVLLLPLTKQTENLLNAERLSWLPRGAIVINPGRGSLIDDDALLAALDAGQVGHATLDVFRVEPLPAEHPFWAHPKVTVTPHIASETRPQSASRVIAENIRRGQSEKPFLHLVDRTAGY